MPLPLSVQPLHEGWVVSWVDGPTDTPEAARGAVLPATVPGQVHTDLLAAGLIADPDVGTAELDQAWVGHSTWRYRRELEWDGAPDGSRVDLVLEGLDTVAEVRVDGTVVLVADDQHVAHRVDVAALLNEGTHTLEITFTSAWAAAEQAEAVVGELPRPYDEPYPYLRKSACNFGWDWGPHYVTAGVWRPVRLETWAGARVSGVRPLVDVTGTSAGVEVVVDLDLEPGAEASGVVAAAVLRDPDGGEVARGEGVATDRSLRVCLAVDDARLWWPVGLGDQPLHDLDVELRVAGETVHRVHRRIGLRSVAVDESPDEQGNRWALVVNGRRVRVRGYNWIPDDPFLAEVTPERLGRRLDQAVEGGANLLRVWGGGYVATEEFLDGCDERGLLVWHDFLFACAAYDERPETVAKVRTEAEQAVTRLSSHPSVVLWCGGNECVWGWHDWGWREPLGDRPWGAGYYTEVLPEVVQRLDPTRPYLPNSPWGGSLEEHPNAERRGPVHIWTVWNEVDYASYRQSDPPFVSEMGWCAPPAWSTLRRAVPEGDLTPDNPVVVHHMRAADGMAKLARGMEPHVGAPADPDDWHYLAQVVQARSQVAGAEWLRSRERCAGVVVWQLNDCWPVLSWSAVDGDGIEKPLWYALRRSFAPRLLTLQPVTPGATEDPTGPDGLELAAVNDGTGPWSPAVSVRRLRLDGTELARAELVLETAPDGTSRAPVPGDVAAPGDPATELLVADGEGQRVTWTYRPERDLVAPPARWDAAVRRDGGALVVEVTARTLLRELALFPDRAAAALGLAPTSLVVDDMLLTVLPGETVHLRLTPRAGTPGLPADLGALDPLTRRPVLRALGDAASPG